MVAFLVVYKQKPANYILDPMTKVFVSLDRAYRYASILNEDEDPDEGLYVVRDIAFCDLPADV